jgi:MFS family permease
MVTQAVQMTLAFVLFGLVASDTVQVWHILVLAVLLGVTNAVDMPTRQAFTVEMVGREDVANAVALNSAIFNGARIIGPAIAGLTIGAFGGDVSMAFLINGISFLAVIVAYAAMRQEDFHNPPPMLRPHTVGEVRSAIAGGLSYVRNTDLVLLMTLNVAIVATFGMNFGVTIPALAQEVLHTDATGFGFLMTASGIGSLVAALGIAFSGQSRPVLAPLGAILLGVALTLAAVLQVFALAMIALLFVGFGAIGMAATANTTIQLAVPDELRGRVMSVYTTVFVGSAPAGALLMGWIASAFGVPASLVVGGIGAAITGAIMFAWMRRIRGARLFSPTSGAVRPAPGGGIVVPARPR